MTSIPTETEPRPVDADEATWADAYGDTEHARALDAMLGDIDAKDSTHD